MDPTLGIYSQVKINMLRKNVHLCVLFNIIHGG